MSTLRWLNEHNQPAIRLPDGRIGIVVGKYVLPVPASVKPLDQFGSQIAIREARRQVADAMAVGLALGAEAVPQKRDDYAPAPFLAKSVAEEMGPLVAGDDSAPEPAFDMGRAAKRKFGEDDTAPFLDAVTGLASEQRGEEW